MKLRWAVVFLLLLNYLLGVVAYHYYQEAISDLEEIHIYRKKGGGKCNEEYVPSALVSRLLPNTIRYQKGCSAKTTR